MAMKFSDGEEEEIVAEINITPLTDIFLVLLIIFMISSSAMMESGLQVKLPSAKSARLSQSEGTKPTFVTIAADGKISVNEDVVSESLTLKDALQRALLTSEEKVVVIRGDESIFLGKAVEIMDAARSAGADKIALATKAPGG